MTALPHDVTDLYLAPVLLAVDRRIEEYAALDVSELAGRIALASDLPTTSSSCANGRCSRPWPS